jgi:hypothetical protein
MGWVFLLLMVFARSFPGALQLAGFLAGWRIPLQNVPPACEGTSALLADQAARHLTRTPL